MSISQITKFESSPLALKYTWDWQHTGVSVSPSCPVQVPPGVQGLCSRDLTERHTQPDPL